MNTTAAAPSPFSSPRVTLDTLRDMKRRREPIAMLTAYDYPTAKLLAGAGLDILLVGDSVATTVLGLDSTTGVSVEFLLAITDAVRRGAPFVFLMADMPYGAASDPAQAVGNAVRFAREGGADAIKLEADGSQAPIVAALVEAGLTVCAHIGLLPQRASLEGGGGMKAQGTTAHAAERLLADARALVGAGAQLLLLEAVPDDVTAAVAKAVPVPLLGCGAGPSADGHVIVTPDLLGFNARPPRFAEVMADAPALISAAARQYVSAIRTRVYPAERHVYHMKRS